MGKQGLIGVQMMMLKNKVAEEGAYETLKKLAEMGYHCVEISQIPMTEENVSGMKRACEEFGIKIAACSAALAPRVPGAPGETLMTDYDKIVADCRTLDCNYLRIGMLPITCLGSAEKFLEFVEQAEAMAKRLAKDGIKLYYHNHHVEFARLGGERMIDTLREKTEALGFELDVHWIQRGGDNPIEVIKQFAGRITLLHLKDYRIASLALPENEADMKAFFDAFFNKSVQFAEVGEGNLPMKEIIETGLACGSEYFIIEQDDQYGKDPYESLQISMDNLKKLGYESWF